MIVKDFRLYLGYLKDFLLDSGKNVISNSFIRMFQNTITRAIETQLFNISMCRKQYRI